MMAGSAAEPPTAMGVGWWCDIGWVDVLQQWEPWPQNYTSVVVW